MRTAVISCRHRLRSDYQQEAYELCQEGVSHRTKQVRQDLAAHQQGALLHGEVLRQLEGGPIGCSLLQRSCGIDRNCSSPPQNGARHPSLQHRNQAFSVISCNPRSARMGSVDIELSSCKFCVSHISHAHCRILKKAKDEVCAHLLVHQRMQPSCLGCGAQLLRGPQHLQQQRQQEWDARAVAHRHDKGRQLPHALRKGVRHLRQESAGRELSSAHSVT